ncbi:DUF262 domain-containing protein [Dictyobacter aurantiacus]|uniref:DUF262 domain-containing protein n=1 Tax=Dictyobacter aurantiacus TaxID=1936993 RepID=A0A401ZRN6_9CHLR|nr:DUF262 domain-containing protein [Dictyobacter aurantiacus]GCE09531.1 hypothetical protein KDAU_68600 [Dictyobacter aurantiacus]
MNEIRGMAKTVRQLLADTKYSVDYYQREYKWEEKQLKELIDDLASRFLQDYEAGHARFSVADYGHYFLGSIIISKKENQSFIIDGQQRLTSLTLFLIYLNNLQKAYKDPVEINSLIFSAHFGQRSFNMNVEEWASCLDALYTGRPFDEVDKPESVQNIVQRYSEIETLLPEEIVDGALLHFIDWLTEKVHLVEITAYSDEDAYTIFETMNDRGLSLNPTDMLKGYLLAKISDVKKRNTMNVLWKQQITKFEAFYKEAPADFFKTWLRSQYAENIRDRKKGSKPGDFDRIGTEFHRWIRDYQSRIGLDNQESFIQFIERDMNFYARHYRHLLKAANSFQEGWESIYYNAQLGFTTQYQLLLAPLLPEDSEEVAHHKFKLVGLYLDILLNRRLWNLHNIGFSTMQYAMYLLMRDIRRQSVEELRSNLYNRLKAEKESFTSNTRFGLNQRNYFFIRLMLMRITHYIEQKSNFPSQYKTYMTSTGKAKFEVEHIWANKPERHRDEFPQPADFHEYRNRIGGLLLLPKSFNASYGALPYPEKVTHYYSQNLLAKSLSEQSYEHCPGFLQFAEQSHLPFKPYAAFNREALDERQELYIQIAEQLWNPEQLIHI